MQTTPITAKDRLSEVASLLAVAIKRLNIRKTSKNREVSLDFTAHPSVHASEEFNSNGGESE
ncbi:MAG: hypothetical protein O2942_11120 [Proteobacteria bacterium]|nr:hypothetical protein [Pseudomonadota bacterium]